MDDALAVQLLNSESLSSSTSTSESAGTTNPPLGGDRTETTMSSQSHLDRKRGTAHLQGEAGGRLPVRAESLSIQASAGQRQRRTNRMASSSRRELHLHRFRVVRPGSGGALLRWNYGLLTLCQLPPGGVGVGLPEFPLYDVAGSETLVVRTAYLGTLDLSPTQLAQLQAFHQKVFDLLLGEEDCEQGGGTDQDIAASSSVTSQERGSHRRIVRRKNVLTVSSVQGPASHSGLAAGKPITDEAWSRSASGLWYIMAPLLDAAAVVSRSPADTVDWASVTSVLSAYAGEAPERAVLADLTPWPGGPESAEALRQAVAGNVVVSRYNGVCLLVRGVGPLSMGEEVAVNVEEGKQSKKKKKKQQDKVYKDFTDFYAKRWGLPIAFQGQPLLEASCLTHPFFSRACHMTAPGLRRQDVLLVPELCDYCFVPPVVWRACLLAYPLLWHLLAVLHAADLRSFLRSSMLASGCGEPGCDPPWLPGVTPLLEAITTVSACPRHNNERLEFLGDSFIKFAVCLHLFVDHPGSDAGELTITKALLVSNANLKKLALDLGVDGALRRHRRRVELWRPPGMRSSFISPLKAEHCNDKRYADALEALVGAFYLSGGVEGGFRLLFHAGVLDRMRTHGLMSLKTCRPANVGASPVSARSTCNHGDRERALSELERILGYRFNTPALAHTAFAHSSLMDSGMPGCDSSYNRLEFLGDAVLDLLVTEAMMQRHPDVQPGELTSLRQAMLNNQWLAHVTVVHGLHQFVRHHSPELTATIPPFSAHVARIGSEVKGAAELKSGGGTQAKQAAGSNDGGDKQKLLKALRSTGGQVSCQEGWPEASSGGLAFGSRVQAPKALGDVLEAVIGAVFLDCSCDLKKTWKVAEPLLHPLLTPDNIPIQPIRELQELCAKMGATLSLHSTSFNIAVGAVSDMAAVIVNTGASAQEGGEIPSLCAPVERIQ
eukprot:jgi/Tetstr1/428404/TSEL_001841.t3